MLTTRNFPIGRQDSGPLQQTLLSVGAAPVNRFIRTQASLLARLSLKTHWRRQGRAGPVCRARHAGRPAAFSAAHRGWGVTPAVAACTPWPQALLSQGPPGPTHETGRPGRPGLGIIPGPGHTGFRVAGAWSAPCPAQTIWNPGPPAAGLQSRSLLNGGGGSTEVGRTRHRRAGLGGVGRTQLRSCQQGRRACNGSRQRVTTDAVLPALVTMRAGRHRQ